MSKFVMLFIMLFTVFSLQAAPADQADVSGFALIDVQPVDIGVAGDETLTNMKNTKINPALAVAPPLDLSPASPQNFTAVDNLELGTLTDFKRFSAGDVENLYLADAGGGGDSGEKDASSDDDSEGSDANDDGGDGDNAESG